METHQKTDFFARMALLTAAVSKALAEAEKVMTAPDIPALEIGARTLHLQTLCNTFLACRKLENEAYAEWTTFTGANSRSGTARMANKPVMENKVLSLRELEAKKAEITRFEAKADGLWKVARACENQRAEVERKITALLPSETWVRVGDNAFGVAVSDWGGWHSTLVVKPWSDELPTLDHRYKGN